MSIAKSHFLVHSTVMLSRFHTKYIRNLELTSSQVFRFYFVPTPYFSFHLLWQNVKKGLRSISEVINSSMVWQRHKNMLILWFSLRKQPLKVYTMSLRKCLYVSLEAATTLGLTVQNVFSLFPILLHKCRPSLVNLSVLDDFVLCCFNVY